jgi:hypothetical protein
MRSIKLSSALVVGVMALAPATALAAHGKGGLGHAHNSPAGCRVSVFAEPHLITSGESAQLFGVLTCARNPSAAAGQAVTVYEHAVGTPGFTVLGTTTTGAGGAYTLPTSAITSDVQFYVVAANARSAKRVVKVAPLVTLTAVGVADGSQLKTGRANKVAFGGNVTPADGGAEVWLERENATSSEEWHVIQIGTVRGDGSYLLIHRFIVPGDANLRVLVRPHGKFDVKGISNTLSFEISQAQNPRLTIFSSADPVPFGQPVTISGVLAGGASQKVTLLGHTVGSPVFTKIEETTTDSTGAYKFTVASATANTYYRVTGAGISSAVLYEGVKYILTAAASTTMLPAGQPITFSGTVTPGHEGKVVYLERENAFGGGFHVVDLATVTASSTYSITHFVFGVGKQVYRVRVPGDPSNQAVSSPTFPIEVTPAPPGSLRPVQQGTLPH